MLLHIMILQFIPLYVFTYNERYFGAAPPPAATPAARPAAVDGGVDMKKVKY
jgi:hypothetical protein